MRTWEKGINEHNSALLLRRPEDLRMMLEVVEIEINYGGINAVRGVSLGVEKGEIVTLVGANGAGKSSTLHGIAGAEKLAGGTVSFEGKDITGNRAHNTAALGVSLVPEGRRIFGRMSVRENLEVGGCLKNPVAIKKGMEKAMSLFPVLKERARQEAGTLSGGEQQMLAIARGLMNEPKLLLLDEPSLGLSPLMEQAVFKVIAEIRRSGTTVLLVEQNANLALKISDRAYVVENGRIVLSGISGELLNDENIKKAYLGG